MGKKKKSRGKERQAKTEAGKSSRPPVLKRRQLPNWPLLALSLAGMALTAYLTVTTWLGASPAFCTEGSACDLVQGSRWGSVLGIPMAFWGFLAYGTLGYIAYRVRNPERHWKFAWTISLLGVSVSLYLTAISMTVLHSTCLYCLASLALISLILVIVAFQRPAGLPSFSWFSWVTQTLMLGVALVVVLELYHSGLIDPASGPEDPYLRDLADHLTRTEAVFYGAFW